MNIPITRAAWSADVDRIRDVTDRTPALRVPSISPARVSFDYRDAGHAAGAVVAVIGARATLSRAFGVTFTERTELSGDDTPRYLLEAVRPGRLTLVIISRVQLDTSQDGAGREDAGRLVAA